MIPRKSILKQTLLAGSKASIYTHFGTPALLDRLTHHAHIIELIGESFRFRQSMQTSEEEDESDPNAIYSVLGWYYFRYEFLMFYEPKWARF